eukprot:TRINITY_DN6782_c0_g1_i2.p1 TRINITY_DN6782_c0_g1~~TRINITY_DN6782_c0_g1_i2.p1  ORF type:complete len:477 (+),score=124.85 TRINITY_DN6782_c0_g1_i2:126-1556(+)
MERCDMTLRVLVMLLCVIVAVARDTSKPLFYESFEETWEGRWIPSEKSEYEGSWRYEASKGHEDYGLLVGDEARKHAIAVELPEKVALGDGKTVVLQYDVRAQNGLNCGGAYLKFLEPQEAGWKPSSLDSSSAYTVMFGPDRCGATNKVHFIFRHKNPKTGEVVEHHLNKPPNPPADKLTHVYTAVLHANHSVSILVDGSVKRTADLLSDKDFDVPVIPAATIPDPEDKKPEDWDERAKIPDPEATKPEDWDEAAPREIEDEEASKPEGWLDDEPDEVDDPEAAQPEEWDEEEDGVWEPSKVLNPKCAEAPGCGVWKRPTKKNPDYKGKWKAPLIENPAYKGKWKPQEIPNPDHFELEKPELEPISAIAVEIWTMQDSILFDNVLITDDEELASKYRDETWKPKYDAEKIEQEEERKKEAEEAKATAGDEDDEDEEDSEDDVPLLPEEKAEAAASAIPEIDTVFADEHVADSHDEL